MRPFSLLVKPACGDCNLRCEYCFYLPQRGLYPSTKHHRMSDDVLETMIRTYMATPQPQYAFGWQGGEPTLMGVDFFRRVVELQKKHGRRGATVANGLQTNATLIDDEFARHLARYHFLVGCSLDGPQRMHDRFRLNAGGGGSHADVLKGIEALRRHGAEFNILVLVSQANVHEPEVVYEYLLEQGFYYQQYIPCVEFDESGAPLPFSISGGEWGAFLCRIFDAWHRQDSRRVSIRHFDSVVNYLVTGQHNVCHMGGDCRQYFVVEHNGDLYPCDFWVREHLRLGNVQHTSWEEAYASEAFKQFGSQKTQWHEACTDCTWRVLCMGDCLKHRIPIAGDPRTLSHLCDGWKAFYAHTHERLEALATQIRSEQDATRRAQAAAAQRGAPQPQAKPPKPNDRCPCGSGKKYKKCCGR